MKKTRRKGPVRIAFRLIRYALLIYLVIGLMPCMIVPTYPDADTVGWPVSSAGADSAMLVEDGEESLNIRLALIESAGGHIRLGTYLFGVDTSGKEMMTALYQAADRGVQVDILTDGILGVFNFHDDPLVHALGSHQNINIYLYNPVDFSKPWNMNGRYHEKYMVVDSSYSMIGGRNISDEFLIKDTAGYSIDLEVLMKRTGSGVSVCDLLTDRFDGMISSEFCTVAYNGGGENGEARELLSSGSFRRGTDLSKLPLISVGQSTLLGSDWNPGDKTPDVMAGLKGFVENTEKSLIWCSPYFCPDEPMLEVLRNCAEVESFTMITNSAATGNNIIASADGVFHRSSLNDLPCEIWEVQAEHSLHTKALLIDERISVIGSFNADMRSAYLDTELMIAVDSPGLSAQTASYMAELKRNSAPASEKAKASGLGQERMKVPFGKNLKIHVMAPLIALIRYLI